MNQILYLAKIMKLTKNSNSSLSYTGRGWHILKNFKSLFGYKERLEYCPIQILIN